MFSAQVTTEIASIGNTWALYLGSSEGFELDCPAGEKYGSVML